MPAALIAILVVWLMVGLVLWGQTQLPVDATVQRIVRVVLIIGAAIWTLLRLFPGALS
jgi:hypothetical protein